MALIGYIRPIKGNPSLDVAQREALALAKCDQLFEERRPADRVALRAALYAMQPGDTLLLWRLSVLRMGAGRLIRFALDLAARGHSLRTLVEGIDADAAFFAYMRALEQAERDLAAELAAVELAMVARRRGNGTGGRPRKLDDATIPIIRRRLWDRAHKTTVAEYGISRSTAYRRGAAKPLFVLPWKVPPSP